MLCEMYSYSFIIQQIFIESHLLGAGNRLIGNWTWSFQSARVGVTSAIYERKEVSNLFIQHTFLGHLLLCAKHWSYTNWEVDWYGLPVRGVKYQLKCRGFLKSWVNHFLLAHEIKTTREAESETSFLSSYYLPTLEPPTTRGTAGANMKATSSWQV